MAINRTVFKIVFVLSILLFLIFPGSAVTDSFHWVGSDSKVLNVTTENAHPYNFQENRPIRLYFPNVELAQGWKNTVMTIPVSQLVVYGGDGNSGWDTTVTFRYGSIDGDIVGTGVFGYNKNAAGTVYYVSALKWDLDLSGYTGSAYIYLDSCDISINSPGSYSTQMSAGGFSDVTDTSVFFQAVYHHTGGSEPWPYYTVGRVGTVYNTNTAYDYYNNFEYTSNPGFYFFKLNRTMGSKAKSLIKINGTEVLNETTVKSTDLEWLSYDIANTSWDVTLENLFGDVDSAQIDFNAIPPTPQTEDTILWGADSYVTGETGTVSWSLSNSNFNSIIYKNEISIYQDVVDLEHLRYNTELPTQTGSLYFNFAGTGNYIAVLKQTNLILPTKIIDSDTVKVVPIGPSYISVNASTIFAGASFDINFSYGFAPSPTYLTGVNAKRLMPDNTFKTEKFWSVQPLFPISANTIYSLSDTGAILKLSQEGKYIFELTDFNKGAVAQTQLIDVIFIVQPPTHNITTSSISVDKEQYQMGETLTGFLKIDNTNFQNTCYLEFYNYDHEIVTNVPQPIFTQSTSFEGLLKTSDYNEDYVFSGVIATLPGSNAARIVAVEGSTRTVIAYDNFSVSTTNVYGYGLELSSYQACVNEKVNIIITAPSAVNITIENPYGNLIKTFHLNGSSTISYTFPTSGQYIIELYRSGERVSQAQATIFINPDCAGESIVVPADGDMENMYKNIFNFMTLPAFWGIIIMIGFVGGLAMKTNRNGERIVSGNVLAFITFALINLFSIVGLFAPYTMYIVISTWIFAGIFFTLGKSLARGE